MDLAVQIYTVIVSIVACVMFMLAYLYPDRRTVVFFGTSVVVILIGQALSSYPPTAVWSSINASMPVLVIIIALEIVSLALIKSGVSKFLAIGILKKFRNPAMLSIMFILLTYVLSLFLNNLATILVLLPIILMLGSALDIETEPMLVLVIIASNIGGASTMIGDFPNIVISRYANASFVDFFVFLGMPLMLFLSLSLVAYRYLFPHMSASIEQGKTIEYIVNYDIIIKYYRHIENIKLDRRMAALIAGFGAMIIAFIYVPWDPAFIALAFGIVLVIILRADDGMLRSIDFSVLLWFLSLFIIAGAFAPAMSGLGSALSGATTEPFPLCVALIVIGTLLTAFLSAGPTTVLLMPLALALDAHIPGNFAFWSLSLGVLAGSSATPIGATAGPVMMAYFERFYKRAYSWKTFLKISIPIVVIFNACSIVYVYLAMTLL